MKRSMLAVLVAGMLVLTAGAASAYQAFGGSFSDDDGNVHEANIEAIFKANITDGCGPAKYCPDSHVTRGQMAKFIARAFSLPAATKDHFDDDEDSIFEADINRLAESGITSGCNPPTNDEYCPENDVTRAQMAVFITKALNRTPTSKYENYFVDDDGSIFEARIDELRNAGVTSGCNPPANDEYCPNRSVTRAQMGTFLAKARNLKANDPTPFGNSTCDPAYSPCVPTVEEVGDLDCADIRDKYPDGVLNDLSFGDPHNLNVDKDGKACEPTGSGGGSTHETFGDGQHLVGTDISAGRYRTRTASSGCYWERQSDTSGDFSAIIANDFTDHVSVVDIAGSDAAFKTDGCATWTDDLSAITSSKTANFGQGTYIVGTDIAAVQWRAPGGDSCYWERLSDFSGEADSIIANDFGTTTPVVTISSSDAGFSSSNCGTWTRV